MMHLGHLTKSVLAPKGIRSDSYRCGEADDSKFVICVNSVARCKKVPQKGKYFLYTSKQKEPRIVKQVSEQCRENVFLLSDVQKVI